ncbi:DUF302 domain-containing protein [Mangrovibacterium marinum]|uniref:Uncharacterized protein (DUF302 family) n=1 Tax=Mangrovibacterium marinum TaxID=1639118 RepID=A0A2T5C2H3_9BACT|nr:DUF302 domain-containing protein [Mangrovibacterium marinum]PTN08851.1 uncharacterized protein (DUF302 family) [Mangrovibacterium marinum]
MFVAGILTGIIVSIALVVVFAPKLLFRVSESQYDFERTKVLIEESTAAENWSMPHQYNLQATMEKHGFDVQPVTVFSICKPDIAVRILDQDEKRHISAMMPCRIAIYETKDGKTYVSRMNAGLLSKLLGSDVNAIMGEAGEGSEKILDAVLKK